MNNKLLPLFFYTFLNTFLFFHGNRKFFNALKRKEIALNFGFKIKTKSQIQCFLFNYTFSNAHVSCDGALPTS